MYSIFFIYIYVCVCVRACVSVCVCECVCVCVLFICILFSSYIYIYKGELKSSYYGVMSSVYEFLIHPRTARPMSELLTHGSIVVSF